MSQGSSLLPEPGGGPPPVGPGGCGRPARQSPTALLEVEVLFPGIGPLENTLQGRPVRVTAPHPGPGVGPHQQCASTAASSNSIEADGKGRVVCSMMDSSCCMGIRGAVVPAQGEMPGPLARWSRTGRPVPPHSWRPRLPGCAGPKRRSLISHSEAGMGSRPSGWGARKPAASWRYSGRPQGTAAPSSYEGRKLALPDAGAWRQLLGHRVQQGRYQPGLPAVQLFQPIQADVGRAQLRPFHPVADSLQGREHPVEHSRR